MHYHSGSLDNEVIVLRTMRLKDLGIGVRSLEGAQTSDRPPDPPNPLPSWIPGHFPLEQSKCRVTLVLKISRTPSWCMSIRKNKLTCTFSTHENLLFHLLENSILHKKSD